MTMAALPACIQPRLGLEVFGFVPPGCFGYLVDNVRSLPLLQEGEVAVIDARAREPENGSLFLIEWMGGGREISETFLRPIRDRPTARGSRRSIGGPPATIYNRPRSQEELDKAIRQRRCLSTSDGPYTRTADFAAKLIGKVVGVLAPDRHTRDELSRRIYVRGRPKHMLPTDYTRGPEPGYVEPAGSTKYKRRTGLLRKTSR